MTRKKASASLPPSPLEAEADLHGDDAEGPAASTERRAPEGESAAPARPVLPVRRPMAQVTRITLFEREVRERLSRAALELLLARLEVLSEGQRTHRGGRDLYFGSTMMTADLARLADVLRDRADTSTAARLVKLLQADDEARQRLESIAIKEAHRIACVPLKALETHLALRAAEDKVYVDVDVEAEF